MASDDSSGAKPAGPVVLRIKLRYDDVDAMVQRFASNIGKSGLFLPTKSIQPIGTEIKFELRLSDDTAVLVGLGRVKSVRQPDPANPKAAFGMAIELMRVTREGREVIMRMLEQRRAMGLPDIGIPMPDDVDSARRTDVETQPKINVAATIRDGAPRARESGPIGEQLLTAPRPGSGPLARAKGDTLRPSAPALAPEPAKPKRPRVADLIARANDASGAVAAVTVPGLDEYVDVERALVRARALAGGDVDSELAALLESAAAPIEIGVEAASAELAKQLGGTAIVKRGRNARWAPPPAIETTRTDAASDAAVAARANEAAAAAAIASVSEAAATVFALDPDPVPVSAHDSAAPQRELDVDSDAVSDFRAPSVSDATATSDTLDEESLERHHRRPPTSSSEMDRLAAEQAIAARQAGAITAVDPEPTMPPAVDEQPPPIGLPPAQRMLIDDDADLASFEKALDAARIHTGEVQAAPAPEVSDDDDAVQLDSLDLELAEEADESTQIGADPGAFDTPAHKELAARLDQRLAEAETEANAELAIALQEAPQAGYETVDASADDFAEEEISDLDVLAEADADDADLLNADGERDASDSHEAPAAPPPPEYDFAAQLDLDDDDVAPPPTPALRPDTGKPGGDYSDPNYDPPSSSYTFAENFPHAAATFGEDSFDEPHQFTRSDDARQFGAQPQTFDEPHRFTPPSETFDEPHGFEAGNAFDNSRTVTPIASPPYPAERDPLPASPAMLHTAPRSGSRAEEDYELEDALSTLDVDLDQLEVPSDPPSQRRAKPLPGMPPEHGPVDAPTVRPASNSGRVSLPKESPRSSTSALKSAKPKQPRARRTVTEDEGVLIDFDDDDD